MGRKYEPASEPPHMGDGAGVIPVQQRSGDSVQCKVTPVILHGVVSSEAGRASEQAAWSTHHGAEETATPP